MSKARDLADGTFDTDTLVVDAANNRVGIGIASPSDVLHVVTPTFGGMTLECTGATADPTFKLLGDSGNYWSLQQDASQGDSFQFRYNNSEKIRILSSGGITFNGDTAAANALDDYEEGTWTPTQGTFSTWSSPTFIATYTKIGRLVQVNLQQTGGTIGWSAGQQMGGLPFNPERGASAYATDTGPTSDNGVLLFWTASNVYFQKANSSETRLVFTVVYQTS